jgi:hypothetical protein
LALKIEFKPRKSNLQGAVVSHKTIDSFRLISRDLFVLLRIAFRLPRPTEFQVLVLRVTLALAAAAIAAGIPGFINVEIGAGIRAGGALAVFLLVYAFNPPVLIRSTKSIHGERHL